MPFNWPLAATANKRSRQRTYHTFFCNPCMKGQELVMACFAKEFFISFVNLTGGGEGCNRGSICASIPAVTHYINQSFLIGDLSWWLGSNDTKPMFIDWSVWSPEFFAPILESTSKSPKFPEKYFYRESSTVAVIAPRTC